MSTHATTTVKTAPSTPPRSSKRKAAAVTPSPKSKKAAAAATVTAKKSGLKGHGAPNNNYNNNKVAAVDEGVAGVDVALASRAELHLHARLALVDASKNSDKYYILQVLVVENDDAEEIQTKRPKRATRKQDKKKFKKEYHLFTRWGRTGTSGQGKLAGPFSDENKAEEEFAEIFKSKTGVDWSNAVAGSQPKAGNYEYLPATTFTDDKAGWFYFLKNDPMGKPDGWYPYDDDNRKEVEALYGEYRAANQPARLSQRVVTSESSGFQYKVDLQAMQQTNTHSGKIRPIQRTFDGQKPTVKPGPPVVHKLAAVAKAPAKRQRLIARQDSSSEEEQEEFERDDDEQTGQSVGSGTARARKKVVIDDYSNDDETPVAKNVAPPVDKAASAKLQAGSVHKDCNVMLNQTNLDANNNKFYKIQLVECSPDEFFLFARWGRVGEDGQKKEFGPFDSAAKGMKEFAQKFKSKTGNTWASYSNDKAAFVSKTGKYDPVELEEDQDAAHAMAAVAAAGQVDPCQLDPATQALVDLIFDHDMFNSAMTRLNLDTKKLPLGALSQTQIAKGFAVLEKIEDELKARAGRSKLMLLSSEFYTVIPHAFGRKAGPVMNSSEKLQEKYEMLNTLTDIEAAQCMQKNVRAGQAKSSANPHPSDLNYQQLATDLTPLDPSKDEDYKIVQNYFDNTKSRNGHRSGMKLRQVWRVDRHKESTRFAKHDDLANRKLLWHGTSVAVVAAILKSGLRIMPHSGGRVGRGIYLADQHQKSAWYVSGTNGKVIMFLVEAALGESNEILHDDSSLTQPPKGFQSVLAKGRTQPTNEVDMEIDGKTVMVPQGQPEQVKAAANSSFEHNEFLLYQESQHRIRYILSFDEN